MRQPLATIGLGVQRDIGPSGRVRPARPAFRVFVHFAQFPGCCFVQYAHRQDPEMLLCNLHKGSHRPPQKFVQFAHLTNRPKCGIIKVQKGEQHPKQKGRYTPCSLSNLLTATAAKTLPKPITTICPRSAPRTSAWTSATRRKLSSTTPPDRLCSGGNNKGVNPLLFAILLTAWAIGLVIGVLAWAITKPVKDWAHDVRRKHLIRKSMRKIIPHD